MEVFLGGCFLFRNPHPAQKRDERRPVVGPLGFGVGKDFLLSFFSTIIRDHLQNLYIHLYNYYARLHLKRYEICLSVRLSLPRLPNRRRI